MAYHLRHFVDISEAVMWVNHCHGGVGTHLCDFLVKRRYGVDFSVVGENAVKIVGRELAGGRRHVYVALMGGKDMDVVEVAIAAAYEMSVFFNDMWVVKQLSERRA